MNRKKNSKLFLLIFLASNFNFDGCQAKMKKKDKLALCGIAITGLGLIGASLSYSKRKNTIHRKANNDLAEACRNYNGEESFRKIKNAIKKGANVNHKTNSFHSGKPLHEILNGNNFPSNNLKFNVVDFLIKKGADINAKDDSDNTPLHKECSNSRQDIRIIEHLLNNGANPNAKNSQENTPIHYYFNNLNNTLPTKYFLNFLIENGADFNVRNSSQETPMHNYFQNINTENYNRNLLIFLIENGANLNAMDNLSRTPIDLIRNKNIRREVFEIFNAFYFGKVSLQNDLKALFETNTFSYDSLVKENKRKNLHRLFLEKRLDKNINEIKNILRKLSLKEKTLFLEWLYTGKIPVNEKSKLDLIKVCTLFNINIAEKSGRSGLIADLKELQKDEKSKDFSIIVKDKEVKVHKFILAARSNLYSFVLNNSNDSDNLNSITDHSGKSYETIKAWVDFLYTDKIDKDNLSEKVLDELSDAVDYYQMNENSMLNYYLY